ncbi:MAG: ECF transporter S component [Lachnospiraceae bacterium]|nr:ECF transporter S component [Lachnospiraceae bacterium]MBP5415231.1 ECF transporter S component [Lachnospiraceae bacterium]MBP5745702.1 ECF transporter S component [Lachnospiraceae bacterium]
MNNLISQIAQNAVFVLVFAGVIILMFLIAYAVEKLIKKKNDDKERILTTRKVVIIGMFSALSTVLMLFEFPVPFAPPGIYKLDFSELPALIGGFAFGPVTGIMIEFIKVLLKTVIKGTSTAFVGELANFFVGCSFVLPATVIYLAKKNKLNAIISCAVGTLVITIVGSSFNAFYLLPTFAKMFGMDIDTIIAMGTAVNSHVTSLSDFIFLIVAPVNILKGVMVSVVTLLIYKPLSPILKGKH